MPTAIKVPEIGESITEGTISQWHKKAGDVIREGEALVELETDKATTTIPSPVSGKLLSLVPEGQTVAIGAVIGQIEEGSASGVTADTSAKPPPAQKAVAGASPVKESSPPAQKPKAPAPAAPAPQPESDGTPSTSERMHAPPSTEGRPASAGTASRRQKMSPIRQRIAERLLASQKTTATLTTFNEADMSAVMALRAKYKELFKDKHQVSLGMMPFFVKAAIAALRTVPIVSAWIDGSEIVQHGSYHIGVAVSTEKGLMVPVLRDADRLSFPQIDTAIADLAARAREGKIAVQELQGGTFTITNGGVFGSLLSTPILNPPQSAILGMHTIQKRPVVVDDQIVIRPMMYLALSYDHRLIDGREAVQFLIRIKECVEHPERLLLDV